MRISVFGLGYVGCVSIACLSKMGHEVIGVDVSDEKVNAIASGRPTIVEPQIDELIADGFTEGRIHATIDALQAIQETEVSLVCVGTPSARDGALKLDAIVDVAKMIGASIAEKNRTHLVILRSTVPPGTTERLFERTLREMADGVDLTVVVIPEFLREGAAVSDYHAPPMVLVGTHDGRPSDDYQEAIANILETSVDEIVWVPYQQAEMMKSLCNAFHALKVTFANEVGALCAETGIDGHAVMRLLTLDRKLNISPAYLRPGLPYGGSCLPKDLAATVAFANKHCVDTPLLRAIGESNESHLERALLLAGRFRNRRRIGMDGLAFKADTDDLRESPLVQIAEHLIGKGYDLRIYDPAVDVARLVGANRTYIEQHIPHLADRMVSTIDELLAHSEVLVLSRDGNEIYHRAKTLPRMPTIVDLTLAGRDEEGDELIDSDERELPLESATTSVGRPS